MVENPRKQKRKKKKMKKTMVKVAKKSEVRKNVLVKPAKEYTRAQVGEMLGFKTTTIVCPSKHGMNVRGGKIRGAEVISYLESGSCRKARIGRKYASGTVTVVAR